MENKNNQIYKPATQKVSEKEKQIMSVIVNRIAYLIKEKHS
jgi:hypothetical protein